MSQQPYFSIIIPAYNRAYILPETIKSVTDQLYVDWEVIIVDDGSTDDTKSVIGEISAKDTRVRYVFQKNAERSVARNNGADHAKGKYLLFLDSDDAFAPEHLQTLKKSIEEQAEPVAMFFTNVCYLSENGLMKHKIPDMEPGEGFRYVLLQPITPSRVCIHKDIFKVFRFDPKIVIVEDLVLWVCIASRFPVFQVKAYTSYYRLHDGNSVDLRRNPYLPRIKGLNRLFNSPDYKAISKQIPAAVRSHLLAECRFNSARHFEFVKNYRKMNQELWQSFRHDAFYRNRERFFMFLNHFPLTARILRKSN